jgi:hypothetical protein
MLDDLLRDAHQKPEVNFRKDARSPHPADAHSLDR